MSKRLSQFVSKPKTIFLIDGLGALATAFILLFLFWRFPRYVGMPASTPFSLAMIAFAFAVYSICCYRFLNTNWRPFLKAIMVGNLLYCCVTMALVVYYYSAVTMIGLTYFATEIIVIVGLVFAELQVLKLTSQIKGLAK